MAEGDGGVVLGVVVLGAQLNPLLEVPVAGVEGERIRICAEVGVGRKVDRDGDRRAGLRVQDDAVAGAFSLHHRHRGRVDCHTCAGGVDDGD